MVDVSAEWIQNQNSRQRKQGYVIITIDTAGDDIVIDTRATAENAPGKHLKQITHSRKYDPLGFSLPVNDIVIELYNYDKMFDSFYKSYAQERLQVDVKYGYRLTQDETVQGGIFYIADVSQDDRILTITAQSTLAFINADKDSATIISSTDTSLYSSSGETTPISQLPNTEAISIGALCSIFNTKYTDLIDYSEIGGTNLIKTEGKTIDIADALQKISNATGANLKITRYDKLIYTVNGNTPFAILHELNMRSRPAYSRTKQARLITVLTETGSENTISKRYEQKDVTQTTSGNQKIIVCPFDDIRKYELQSVVDGYSSNSISRKILLNIVQILRNDNDSYIKVIVDGGEGILGTGEITFIFRARRENAEYVEQINTSGEICDVSNAIADPNTTKISNYLANRDIYEFDLRGDPSIDVGDYVYVELDNAYKKALVLESELTFDGSFKDNMKVRIIDTDFEEIIGNTHEELAEYTHEQLNDYTHKELMTEVISNGNN